MGVQEGSGLPQDPMILLSYINTQLRDNYGSLEELCASLHVEEKMIREKLAQIDYEYDEALRRFV